MSIAPIREEALPAVSMEIAPIRAEDLPALSALYQQLLPNESSVEQMEVALQTIKNTPNQIVLGAHIDGRLVGSVLGIACQMLFGPCKTFMVIEDVVVDANYRRQGVGEALIRSLETYAAERNCSYCMLITDTFRKHAQRFYASLGYETDQYLGYKKHL